MVVKVLILIKILCFEIQIGDLKEIIAHTNSNLVGLTFNFKDGTTRNFMETSGSTNDFLKELLF
jgi:hypothetical protein